MAIKLQTLTFNSEHQEQLILFYNELGANFYEKTVKKGSKTWVAQFENLEIQIYAVSKMSPPPIPMISLRLLIQDLSAVLNKLKTVPGVKVLMDEMALPDCKSAIVLDPDGRSVELCELWPESGEEAEGK